MCASGSAGTNRTQIFNPTETTSDSLRALRAPRKPRSIAEARTLLQSETTGRSEVFLGPCALASSRPRCHPSSLSIPLSSRTAYLRIRHASWLVGHLQDQETIVGLIDDNCKVRELIDGHAKLCGSR